MDTLEKDSRIRASPSMRLNIVESNFNIFHLNCFVRTFFDDYGKSTNVLVDVEARNVGCFRERNVRLRDERLRVFASKVIADVSSFSAMHFRGQRTQRGGSPRPNLLQLQHERRYAIVRCGRSTIFRVRSYFHVASRRRLALRVCHIGSSTFLLCRRAVRRTDYANTTPHS